MQNGKQSKVREGDGFTGITLNESDNLSKVTRGMEVHANLEKQKAIVIRQNLVAKIEQLKADIETKKLELLELEEQLKVL